MFEFLLPFNLGEGGAAPGWVEDCARNLSPSLEPRVFSAHPHHQGLRLELGDLRGRETHRIGGRTQPRPDDEAVSMRSTAHRSERMYGAPALSTVCRGTIFCFVPG